jgi:hypothetical protein
MQDIVNSTRSKLAGLIGGAELSVKPVLPRHGSPNAVPRAWLSGVVDLPPSSLSTVSAFALTGVSLDELRFIFKAQAPRVAVRGFNVVQSEQRTI